MFMTTLTPQQKKGPKQHQSVSNRILGKSSLQHSETGPGHPWRRF
ncbi:hypothetical protein [Methanobacterium ferruginis]|nr:hypothetical protein [Methanobacterium ferruginis]